MNETKTDTKQIISNNVVHNISVKQKNNVLFIKTHLVRF